MSVRDDEFRDPNPGRGPFDSPMSTPRGYADESMLADVAEAVARHGVPRGDPPEGLPTIGRSDASAFMRHGDKRPRHTVPANIERAVRASTAAGLPAEAMVIENMALMLVVEFDGGIRLRTALPDPDAVAETLEKIAQLVRSGAVPGLLVVDDEEASRG